MYPLNMHNPALAGYAKANDDQEHRSLSALGYLPAFVESEPGDVDALRQALDDAGIAYDKRWGAAKLKAALGAE